MRNLKRPPVELQTLFNQEWKRAKKLCKPFFDEIVKPRLYVAKTLQRNWLGYHSGRNGQTLHKINGKWLKGDIIVIKESHALTPPTMVFNHTLLNTIRHEICHVKHHNHKIGFHTMLRGLQEKTTPLEVV